MKNYYSFFCKSSIFLLFTVGFVVTIHGQNLTDQNIIEIYDTAIINIEDKRHLYDKNVYQFNTAFQDHPDDQYFSDQFGLPGLDDAAYAIIEYNGTTCIGGTFIWFEGEVRLNRVACWDDTEDSWMPMGEGFNNTVFTLTVFEGDLYAGGTFTMSGDNTINGPARWNGAEWEQVEGGLNGPVYSLSVYNGELIAGGNFNATETTLEEDLFLGTYTVTQEEPSAGPVGAFSNGWLLEGQQEFEVELISVFEGRSFKATPYAQFGGAIESEIVLALIEGSEENIVTLSGDINTGIGCTAGINIILGPALTIDGSFNPEDDSEFTFGIRDNTQETCGVSYDDILFTAVKNSSSKQLTSSSLNLNNIARFDGTSWRSLGGGFDSFVWNLSVVNGELYAAGNFTESSAVQMNRIAKWNGENWEAVGTGFNALPNAITEYNETLVAGGFFTQSGGESVLRVAEWDDDSETWLQMGDGFDLPLQGLTVFDGELYASGALSGSPAEGYSGVNKWNATASSWEPVISEPLDQSGQVFTISTVGERLAISGQIRDHSLGLNHFAYLENGTPEPESELNFELKGLFGTGMQTFLYNDEIILGGSFNYIGNVEARNIATWDGSDWSPIGDGIGGSSVRSFTVYEDQLLAAASGINQVFSWNESASEWNQIGGDTGLANVIWRMVVHNDSLYVAGFRDPNSDHSNPLIRWNPGSSEWEQIGDGLDGGNSVRGLTVYNGELYAGGNFHESGDEVLNGIARWDENTYTWQPVGEGLNGNVISLEVFNNELYVAGGVSGSGETTINGVARWDNNSESWQDAGSEDLMGVFITELSVYDGALYVTGLDFDNQEGIIKKLDNSTGQWNSLGSNADDIIYGVTGLNGILHIPGWFNEIGGKAASGFVTYDTGTGVFADQPVIGRPNSYSLAQNYPNPFNPSTIIRYEIPVNSEVKLEVFNLLGQRVATLVNDHITAGAHEVIFDGSNLASGVYIYRLSAGDFMKTQKLTLIK